jgi:hypothetical protein
MVFVRVGCFEKLGDEVLAFILTFFCELLQSVGVDFRDALADRALGQYWETLGSWDGDEVRFSTHFDDYFRTMLLLIRVKACDNGDGAQ